MTVPYQRITVPTSEKWSSVGQKGSSTAPSSVQKSSVTAGSQAMVIQPPHSLVTSAPNLQTSKTTPTVSNKKFSAIKSMLWAGLLVGLLVAATSAFAFTEQEAKQEKQTLEAEPTKQHHSLILLEKPVMTLPNIEPNANNSEKTNAHIKTTVTHGSQASMAKPTSGEKVDTDASEKGNAEATNGVLKKNRPVQQSTSSAVQIQPDVEVNADAPDPLPTSTALPTTVSSKVNPTPTSATETPNSMDSNTVALLALGVAGAGVAASVGLAINTRRSLPKVEKFKFDELVPKPALGGSSPGKSVSNQVGTVTPASRGASDLAYIDQNDWSAALERVYGVNARSGPLSALVSSVGARNANEDYGCAYELTDVQTGKSLHCIFVADGCGGHNGGRDASCLAVRAASEAVLQSIKLTPAERVEAAFKVASAALIRAGRQWDANSLRTTLIVVLADESNYYCGWIGDGGIDLHQANGQWVSLLKPHKSGAQNLLAASLGPDQVGEPSFITHPRQAGDRLYVGSDGVFDVYSDPRAFWGSWFEGASIAKAPQLCLAELLAKCAEHEAFDDNMTVAYLHTPTFSTTAPVVKPKGSEHRLAFGASGAGHQTA